MPKVERAGRLAGTSGDGILRVGIPIPTSDLGSRSRASASTVFALADKGSLFGQAYPAISTDEGHSWVIDGPRFYYAAAQGGSGVSQIQASPPSSAFAWGLFGNYVRVTKDAGRIWYEADLGDGIQRVWSKGGVLEARVFGPTINPDETVFAMFLYISRDYGMTWRLTRRLANFSY